MAPKTNPPIGPTEPAPRGAPPYPAIFISSFAVVLTAMMFVTGAAQRSALPRLLAIKERVLPAKKAPEAAAAAATAAEPSAAPWSAASDSVRMLEDQLAMAIEELAGARAGLGPAEPGEGGLETASAPFDSAGMRDLLRLVKVLDAMKPADAARILDAADEEIAVEAIRRLKERNAGKVLALMQPGRAVTVGQVLGRAAEIAP